MRRVGLPDIAAALIVAVIVLMPPREARVEHAYRNPATYEEPEHAELVEVARVQAELARQPQRAELADRLAELLVDLGQTDDALRVVTAAAERGAEPRWRAELAVASVYSDRIELEEARAWARRALESCREAGCPSEEAVRMEIFADELDKAIDALAEGIDPRLEPVRFREKIRGTRPPVRVGP